MLKELYRKLVSKANLTAQISVPVLYDSPALPSHSNMIQLFQQDTELNRVESTSKVIKTGIHMISLCSELKNGFLTSEN